MPKKKIKLNLDELDITTFQTTSTTSILRPDGGASFPAICSCFGTCDDWCNGGSGTLAA
jgi:hypothetical protein